MSPYFNVDFFGFVVLFFTRLLSFVSGRLSLAELSLDEIQIACLSLTAISSALVGVFLVVRKTTMLANALSHTVLPAIVCTFLLFQNGVFAWGLFPLLIASLVSAAITTFLTQWLTQRFALATDSSIGLVFTTLFAMGVVMVNLFAKHAHIGLESITGNIDMVHVDDLGLALFVCVLNVLCTLIFYKQYQITSFDPSFSRASGIKVNRYHYLLMMQVALSCTVAFRMVGVILVLSFLVTPAITARVWTHQLKKMILLAMVIGISSSFVAVALSRHLLSLYDLAVSTAGLTVIVQGIVFLISAIARYKRVSRVSRTSVESI